ncbi:MAG: hypothetical protein AVDCRST_MAG32-1711 [uncultured Nocardioides sp.]|uniref:Lipoprotein n=1 Tax=uncultured Nocardioides sp. TaxID=198441 RepID=A0A6J4N9I2_9ACTN|nr:MAG: hypothetical protein AVDCRST_MAG32-1711 [uncultured Nocardioides sp.]
MAVKQDRVACSRHRRRSLLTGLAAAVLSCVLAGTVTGCSAECVDVSGSDCVSLFNFDGRKYFAAPTQIVESVQVGKEVGTGTHDPCYDQDPACFEPTDTRVFAFPGVPPKQAVVLTNDAGDGFVYIVTKKPTQGWDNGLADWMERAAVRMPRDPERLSPSA